jgi:sulfate/thiosulfate transport system substrate-binding protein
MKRITFAVLALFALAALAAGCGGGSSDSSDSEAAPAENDGGDVTLSLAAYSTPREVYQELIRLFQETEAGAGVSFEESYASSGEQSRAVESGLPADYVAFSLEPDITRLVDAGLIDADWNANEHKGMVSDSVVVFAVRKGNPKEIQTWDDLVRDGIEVITPNPFTSGGAKWNLMAAYGAQIEQGKSEEEATDFVARLLANTPVQDKSAREALQTFSQGKGDVMLAYENEAIFVQAQGEDIDYVVPEETILIENPIAAMKGSEHLETVQAWIDFVRSPEAQRVFGEHGYRPVNQDVAGEFDFPQPSGLFTIADFGGWAEVNETFFDREDGVVAKIEQELGVPTAD